MKQKMLVISVSVVAAIACIAIIAYLGEYGNLKRIKAEKAQVEKELKGAKETLAKTRDVLNKAESAIAGLKVQVEQVLKAKTEDEAKIKALEQQLLLATARNKEGFEHAAIRQVGKNKKLPQAQKEAERIAVRGGYVDLKTRREIRIKCKGGDVAFPLERDEKGKMVAIKEYKKGKDGKFNPVIERKLAPDFKSSKFLGDIKGAVQPYEYIHTPK